MDDVIFENDFDFDEEIESQKDEFQDEFDQEFEDEEVLAIEKEKIEVKSEI